MLALGIGASSAIFSLVRAAYFEVIPGSRAGTWIRLYSGERTASSDDPKRYGRSSRPDLLDIQERAPVFRDVILSTRFTALLGAGGVDGSARGDLVSGNFFSALGISPFIGRLLVARDDSARGASAVVVLGHRFWKSHYASSPTVLGATLLINGSPFVVIGVAPAQFRGIVFDDTPDLYVPIAMQAQAFGTPWVIDYPDARMFSAMARPRDGVSLPAAQAAVEQAEAHRKADGRSASSGRTVMIEAAPTLLGGAERAQYHVDRVITLLSAVVGLLLLVACASVTNLLLARAAVRRREVAVRIALGASRRGLIGLHLLENLLLAISGGALGILVAFWGVAALRIIPFIIAADLRLDYQTLAFGIALSLLTGLGVGLAVGIQTTRTSAMTPLRETAGIPRAQARVRNALMIIQLALSLMIAVGAMLLLRSVQSLVSVNPGYDVTHVLAGDVQLSKQAGFDFRSIAQYDRFMEGIRGTPGVRRAGTAYYELMGGKEPRSPVDVRGYVAARDEDRIVASETVGPDYFEALGVPLVRGRVFDVRDGPGTSARAVVNATMAERYWRGRDAIGGTIIRDGVAMEVIGIVGDVAFSDLRIGHEPRYYAAIRQAGYAPQQQALYVRFTGTAQTVAADLQQTIRRITPGIPFVSFRPLSDSKVDNIRPTALLGNFLSGFGVLALAISAVGLGGLVSFVVAQRTRELGIRLALGANDRDITSLVLHDACKLVGAGIGAGVVGSLLLSRVATVFVFGISALDPVSFLVASAVLASVVMLAAYLPAWRAGRINPIIVLRSE